MRCLADAFLGRRQFQLLPHHAVKEWIGSRVRRPHALIKPAKDHAISTYQTRFDEAEDLQARMRATRRKGRAPLHQARERLWQITTMHSIAMLALRHLGQ